MKIAVAGAGYVGLSLGTLLSIKNEVYILDVLSEKVDKILQGYRENYSDMIAYSQLRWWGWGSKLEGFLSYRSRYFQALDIISEFYKKRAVYTLPHMQEFLGLGEIVNLIIQIKGRGKVQVNSIIPTSANGVWVGQYFTNIPIVLKAIPDVGFSFSGWGGKVDFDHKTIEITLFSRTTIVANFK